MINSYRRRFMKKCKKCGLEFEGMGCKPCRAKYMREWNAKNPDKAKKIREKRYKKNRSYIDQKNQEWTVKNREKSNAIKKAYKHRNRDKYLAQQREYAANRYVDRKEELLEKQKSPERREVLKQWREKNRLRLNAEYLQRYHESDDMKIKHSARNKVYRAIKSGKLVKATECSQCGSIHRIQAHHIDYSKPLEVVWLCRTCHTNEHSKYFKQDL